MTTRHRLAVAPLPGRSVAVPAAESRGLNDTSAWPFIVFWLLALQVALPALVWLWLRWGSRQTWLVGAPVLLGILWGLNTEAMRPLPYAF